MLDERDYLNVGDTYVNGRGELVYIKRYVATSLVPYVGDNNETYMYNGCIFSIPVPDIRNLVRKASIKDMANTSSWPMPTTSTPVVPTSAPVPDTSVLSVPPPAGPQGLGTIKAPHVHARWIKAWADGETIQYKGPHCDDWRDLLPPGQSQVTWDPKVEYRIKPLPVEYYAAVLRNPQNQHSITLSALFTTPESLASCWSTAANFSQVMKLVVDPVTNKIISATIQDARTNEV